jgi:chromosomal replication initiation ATPase DnaA
MIAREKPRQLALDLPSRTNFAVEDFLVGPSNEAACDLLDAWPAWPDPLLVLVGPPGAGKSHLGAIWADRAHALRCDAFEITHARVPELASRQALLIEAADAPERDEAAMFHLVNLLRDRGAHAVLTATTRPDGWGLTTPDLLSRLRLAPVAEILPPDDALMKAVLVKLFLDRQLIVDTAVIDAVALHLPRSVAAARAVVEAIDRAALERGRRVTRALALEHVARWAGPA